VWICEEDQQLEFCVQGILGRNERLLLVKRLFCRRRKGGGRGGGSGLKER
jgi:hypothetical protein